MNKSNIEVNCPDTLEVTDLVVRKDSTEENLYRVQFLLSNKASKNLKVEDIELRMFNRTNHYIGHEECFVFEQSIAKGEDEAFEVSVDLPDTFKKGVLKIKTDQSSSSTQVFWIVMIFLLIMIFAAK